jgi:hypothetical protein
VEVALQRFADVGVVNVLAAMLSTISAEMIDTLIPVLLPTAVALVSAIPSPPSLSLSSSCSAGAQPALALLAHAAGRAGRRLRPDRDRA